MAWQNLLEIGDTSISYLSGVSTPPTSNVQYDALVLGANPSAWSAAGGYGTKNWNIDNKLSVSVTVTGSNRNIIVTDLVNSTVLLNASGSGGSAIQKADACFWIDEANEVACCVACYGTSYNNVWVDGKSADSNALYQIIKGLVPVPYNWVSVPSVSGKNGILYALSTLTDINDGDPITTSDTTKFSLSPTTNVGRLISDRMNSGA